MQFAGYHAPNVARFPRPLGVVVAHLVSVLLLLFVTLAAASGRCVVVLHCGVGVTRWRVIRRCRVNRRRRRLVVSCRHSSTDCWASLCCRSANVSMASRSGFVRRKSAAEAPIATVQWFRSATNRSIHLSIDIIESDVQLETNRSREKTSCMWGPLKRRYWNWRNQFKFPGYVLLCAAAFKWLTFRGNTRWKIWQHAARYYVAIACFSRVCKLLLLFAVISSRRRLNS